jgi:hypothetical protein
VQVVWSFTFIKFTKKTLRSKFHLNPNSHSFRVPNAKPGRDSTELEIFGMEGIPLEEDPEQAAKKQKTEESVDSPVDDSSNLILNLKI